MVNRPVLCEPRERGSQVVVVLLQAIQPCGLAGPDQAGFRLLGQREAAVGMATVKPVGLPRFDQPLERILPDRLEHPEPWLGISPLVASQEALVDQGRDAVDDIETRACLFDPDYGLRRLQRAPPDEDREAPVQRLLRRG